MQQKIERKKIEEELKDSYLTYAMSVNTNRAIPDVRDGLKPSTRRILYAMHQMNLTSNKNYDKCAAVVGEVMKNFHPHGDAAIYSTLVGLEQDFAIRYPLVDGQGNFGSIDDDPAGAMRYTECRLTKLANTMLIDIQKDTVDFQPNYKDSTQEPTILPTILPNLLVNGTTGIGVGYLTRIPPHNLSETVDALLLKLEQPETSLKELMKKLPGPDFPTGALLIDNEEIEKMYRTGKGNLTIRAKTLIQKVPSGKNGQRDQIIITEIPYQVKKNQLLEKIYQLIVQKTITGISDLRDESDQAIRIVIDLKKGEVPEVVLNQLYKHTSLQTRFNAILLCLVDGLPKVLTLPQILQCYLDHREKIIIRKTQFELNKAKNRLHIVEGYRIALKFIQEIIEFIQQAATPQIALDTLIAKYELSTKQAREILGLTLRQLTGLERKKVEEEYHQLTGTILKLEEILEKPELVKQILKTELIELKKGYGDPRRTNIVEISQTFRIEDLITEEQVTVTLSHAGYIKRTPLHIYQQQKRGGVGKKGFQAKEKDYVEHLFLASSHDHVLFFTNLGKCYGLKVHEIPEGTRRSMGRAIINLLPKLQENEKIAAFIPVQNFDREAFIFMVTKTGLVKKCDLSFFKKLRVNGLTAIKLNDNDELVDVQLTIGENDILLLTKQGSYTRFKESAVRSTGRNTKGVKGMKLNESDKIIRMISLTPDISTETTLLIVTETGYGKRTFLADYPVKQRNRKSVKAINNGLDSVVSGYLVKQEDELILLNSNGNITRISVNSIPIQGRVTQGVRVMKISKSEKVVDIGKVIE